MGPAFSGQMRGELLIPYSKCDTHKKQKGYPRWIAFFIDCS